MIDFDAMKQYLDNRKNRKYFIPAPDTRMKLTLAIQSDILKLLDIYSLDEIKNKKFPLNP
jgi:hypothetical protein